MNFHGTNHNDNFSGGKQNDTFTLSQGGEDTAKGQGGNDTFRMGGAFDAGDRIDGGSGDDTITLDGNYAGTHAVTLAAATLTNVETMVLASGHSYTLDFSAMAFTPLGFTLSGGALGASSSLHLTTGGAGTFYTTGGTGNDVIHAGAADDAIDLTQGGNDTVIGGSGFASVNMGQWMTTSDRLSHVGEIDIDGDYTGVSKLVMNGNVTDTLYIKLGSDHDYDIAANDAVVAAGQTCVIDGGGLSAGHGFSFDGSAEKNGQYDFVSSFGNDILHGGAKNDTFELDRGNTDHVYGGAGNDVFRMSTTLDASDVVSGGAGSDTVRLSDGDYALTLNGNFTGIETLIFDGANNFAITTVDANVAKGAVMTIDTSLMPINTTATFDGSAETNGAFHFIGHIGDGNNFTGGTGDDVVTAVGDSDYVIDFARGGNDTFHGVVGVDTEIKMGGTLTAADRISNGGNIYLDGNYAGSHKLVLGAHTLVQTGYVELAGGHDYDITLNAATVDGTIHPMEFSGLKLLHNSFRLDGSAETHTGFIAIGGGAQDTLIGGGGGDTLESGGGGTDHIYGGGGDDTIQFEADYGSSDRVNGGAGNDNLILGNGDDLNIQLFNNLTSIENLGFAAFHNYVIVENNGNVAKGATLTVNATNEGPDWGMTFHGEAERDGNFHFLGGPGIDEFDDGGGNDVVDGGLGGDFFQSGGGNDTYVYTDPFESSGLGFDGIVNFDVRHDHFDFNVTVKSVLSPLFGGTVNEPTFDSDIASAMDGVLGKHQAVVYQPNTGDYGGFDFLIIDANDVAGYQVGEDYIIDVDFTHLTKGMFI